MVAEVIINSIAKELNRSFDYIIPENLKEEIKIGSRVFVPFGRQKKEEGFVINIKEASPFANKEIILNAYQEAVKNKYRFFCMQKKACRCKTCF